MSIGILYVETRMNDLKKKKSVNPESGFESRVTSEINVSINLDSQAEMIAVSLWDRSPGCQFDKSSLSPW